MAIRALSGLGFSLLVVVIAGACAGRTPASQAPAAPEASTEGALSQEQLEAQFEREAEPIQKQPLRIDGLWQAYLEAKSPPTLERHEEYYTIVADLGWESELTCYVYNRTIDAGTASHTMLSEAKKAVEFRRLVPYHLANAGLDPILGIRGIYHVDHPGVVAAGDYKLMVMPRLEFPVLCTHDAPGYAESFARVTTEFAESFGFESKLPEPMRGELWRIMLGEVPVGFMQRYTYEVDSSGARTVSVAARFLPTAPGEIAFEDLVEIVSWDRQGSLLHGRYLSFENGAANFELELEQIKQSYAFSGTIQDKPIRGNFRSKHPIRGQLAFERRLKQLAKKHQKSRFDQWEYLPSLDPSQSSKVSYQVTPHDGAFIVEASLGQRAMVMQANGRGVVKQQILPIGSRQIQIELVAEVGEL